MKNNTPKDNQNQNQRVVIPAQMVPVIRDKMAIDKNNQDNILIYTWGGIGDIVCAEPCIRFMVENYKSKKISLATMHPEVFEHLKFTKVYDLKKDVVDPRDFLLLETLVKTDHILWQYSTHMRTHPVDFCSMSATGGCLYNDQKEIQLPSFELPEMVSQEKLNNSVVIHPGKHWNVKTFPQTWWYRLINLFLTNSNLTPIIVGKSVDENIGYVNFKAPQGCIDLRDKLSFKEFISISKNAKRVFSNDSAIIHIATAGKAHIGCVATVKHPDFLTHWRQKEFGFRTKFFQKNGAWNYYSLEPCQREEITIYDLPKGMTWENTLPNPFEVVDYFKSV